MIQTNRQHFRSIARGLARKCFDGKSFDTILDTRHGIKKVSIGKAKIENFIYKCYLGQLKKYEMPKLSKKKS